MTAEKLEQFDVLSGPLVDLNLSGLDIKEVREDTFRGLGRFTNLKSLRIYNMSIKSVEVNWLSHLVSLEELSLELDGITQVTSKMFAGLDNLEYLHLSGYNVKSIDIDVFEGLARLKRVNLDFIDSSLGKAQQYRLANAYNDRINIEIETKKYD